MRLIYIALIFILFSGCIQELDTFKKAERILIVEGSISDKKAAHTVKVNYTKPFNTPSDFSDVSAATVEIVDNLGNRELLTHTGKDSYQSDTSFFGVVGRFYHVEITLRNGLKYHSDPEELLAVPEIQDAWYERELVEVLTEDNVLIKSPRITYKVKFADTPGERNYYRWRYQGTYQVFAPEADSFGDTPRPINRACPQIVNGVIQYRPTRDCWVPDFDNESLVIESDEFFNGKTIDEYTIFSLEVSSKFSIGYYNVLSQVSMSKGAYEYLNALKTQMGNKGSIFETSNYQIVGNIHSDDNPDELVLGYFMTGAVSEKSVFVNALDLPDVFPPKDCTPNNVNCLPLTCIDCTKNSSLATNVKPAYWPLR